MTYVAEVLADAPSVFLKLDDATTAFADSSGNTHVQTVTATLTANQSGPSTEITASALFGGGRIDEDFGSTTSYSALTVEGWYKSTSGNGTLWTSRGTTGTGFTLFIGATGAGFGAVGQVSFGLDGALYQGVLTNATFHDGMWHHIVGIFSRASGTIVPSDFSIYVDGQLQAVTQKVVNGSATSPVTPSRNWTAGQHPAGWSNGTLTNTNLAALAVYSSVLSGARITTHYTAMNLPPPQDALIQTNAEVLTQSTAVPQALVQTSAEIITQALAVPQALVQSNAEALTVPDVVPVALVESYAEIMILVPTTNFTGWGMPI